MIRLRDYKTEDLVKLKGNDFLRERTVYVQDFEERENYTIEKDGEVVMIFSYKPYAPRRYTVYMEGSNKLDMAVMRQAKKYWLAGIEMTQPIRIETCSIANEINDRFHRFFGFELEGTKRNYLDGEDYNIWGCVWDG